MMGGSRGRKRETDRKTERQTDREREADRGQEVRDRDTDIQTSRLNERRGGGGLEIQRQRCIFPPFFKNNLKKKHTQLFVNKLCDI